MKRLWLVLLIVAGGLLGLLAGSAYWAGLQAEKTYWSSLAAGSTSPQLQLKGEYWRGWWTSEAFTRINVAAPTPLSFNLNHRIYHGILPIAWWLQPGGSLQPVQAVVRTVLAPDTSWAYELVKLYGAQEPVVILSVVAMDGGSEHTITMPPLQVSAQEAMTSIDFKGLQGRLEVASGGAALSGEIDLPALQLASQDEGSLLLRNLQVTTNQQRSQFGLLLGNFDLSLAGFQVKPPADPGKTVELENISIHVSATPQGDFMDFAEKFSVAKVSVAGDNLGEGYLQLAAHHLNQTGLVKLRDLSDRLATGRGDSAAALEKLNSLLQDLLQVKPKLGLETRIHTIQGDLDASTELVLQDPGPIQQQVPPLWQRALAEAKGEVSIAKTLLETVLTAALKNQLRSMAAENEPGPDEATLERAARTQLQQQLAALLKQRYIQLQGNTYKAVGSFQGGRLVLNGREIPLPP